MARGPVATRGASTVVPAASLLAANAKQKVLTAAQTGLQRIFFTSADLKDPERLFQVIAKLRDFITQALQPLRSCPILTGNLLQSQALTTTGPTYVDHGLGRAPVGVIATSGPSRDIADSIRGGLTLPVNVTAAQKVAVQAKTTNGSYDLWIF